MSNRERHERRREELKNMSLSDATSELSNEVYLHSGIIEELEFADRRVIGNGHHMRQELALISQAYLVDRWAGPEEEKIAMAKQIISMGHGSVRPHVLTAIMGIDYPIIDTEDLEKECFEYLLEMPDLSLQVLIVEMGDDFILTLLKSATEEVREKLYKNVSKRKAKMLCEDVECMGPVKVSDVNHVHKNTLKVARMLCFEGGL